MEEGGVLAVLYVVTEDEPRAAQQGLVAGVPALALGVENTVVVGIVAVGSDIEEIIVFFAVAEGIAGGIFGSAGADLIPGLHRQKNGADPCDGDLLQGVGSAGVALAAQTLNIRLLLLFQFLLGPGLNEFVDDLVRSPGTLGQHLLDLLMGHALAAGELFKGNAGAVRQVGTGVHIIGHRLPAGGIPARLKLPPLSGGAIVSAGGRGTLGGVIGPMQQRPAQGGLVFQGLGPVQPGLVGHEGPLAAAGGVQGPEIGLVALGKALLVQILAVGPVITDVGDEVAAHIAHLGVALVDEHDLIPVVPIAAPLHGNDPHILAPIEQDGLGAIEQHGAVAGAGAGTDIDLVIVNIGVRAHAAQHGNDHARQKQQDQQRGNEPLDGIHFCHRGCHSGISSFPKQVKRTY